MNHFPLILLLCILSTFNFATLANEGDDEAATTETVQIVDGQVVIQLEEELQQLSGLETQRFKQTEFQAEFIAYGKAISASPLTVILNQYLSASAKQAGAKARLSRTEKAISRLRNLHKNEIISTRKLQAQQSQYQTDKAIYDEMHYKSKLIVNNSKLQWGEVLTHWATGRHSPQFEQLLDGSATLLSITLPAGSAPLAQTKNIIISPSGNRKEAVKVAFVSLLPTVNEFSQGLQYIFITDNKTIKTGMNITAWLPKQNTQLTGIIIPESSLVWHLGQSFIFIKIDEEHFVHRNIAEPIKVHNGYFIAEQLSENEQVVIKGTQMLLSHEFRSQIPDEYDD
jgi:hypothetical protein